MSELKIINQLVNVEEREQAAIRGALKCACGNEYFRILFFGKRTKGILAPDIIRQKGKINIMAYCETCEKSYSFDNYIQPQIQFNDHSQLTPDLSLYDSVKLYQFIDIKPFFLAGREISPYLPKLYSLVKVLFRTF